MGLHLIVLKKLDDLLLSPEERQEVFKKVNVLPNKSVLDAYLEAQITKVITLGQIIKEGKG